MALTRDQLALIHIAKKRLGLDDGQYRLILLNIGGEDSSKNMDNAGFEQVMAFFEQSGFRAKTSGINSAALADNYWRARAKKHGNRAARKIRDLHAACKATGAEYGLAGMCLTASNDAVALPEELEPREAFELIEALKAILKRRSFAKHRDDNINAAASNNG